MILNVQMKILQRKLSVNDNDQQICNFSFMISVIN